jgi:hypothetical protein
VQVTTLLATPFRYAVRVALLLTLVEPLTVTTKGVVVVPLRPVMLFVAGAMLMEVTVINTVADAVPLNPCADAVMVAVPIDTAVARPVF